MPTFDLGKVVGPQGPQGERGLQGLQGVQGERGPQGLQGIQGETGPQGEQGVQGPPGDPGAKGDTGATGPQGERGPQGPQGIQGIQGPKGDTGAQGPAGSVGATGPQGPAGATGPQGPAGAAGANGKSAYDSAKSGGYTGTESQFNTDLSQVSGKVNKSGDTMTGKLTLPSAELRSNRIWATITPSGDSAGLVLGVYDDQTGLESAFGVGTEGLTYYDRNGNDHMVYHAGNKPDIYVQDGDVYGTLVAEGYDAPGGGIAYRVRLFMNDDYLNGCGIILYPGKGVYIMDNNGSEYEVIHAGNIARYIG